MQDKLTQMVHKDLVPLALGFLQLNCCLIGLVELSLHLIEELHAFDRIFGYCHARCQVG